jgi:hypothetical protein
MWLLNIIPDFVFHLLLLVGIIGIFVCYFFKQITLPLPYNEYKFIVEVLSVFLVLIGVYFEGSISDRSYWNQKISDLQIKIAQAEEKSSEYNVKLIEQVSKNDKLIEEKKNAQTQVIQKVITKYDNRCELPNATIRLHDIASQNEFPGSTSDTDGNPSNVKASDLITTVTINYSTYYEMREKLIAWQQWYSKNKQIFDSIEGVGNK